MKVNSSTRTVLAILLVVALAIAFWVLLLGPKRQEASNLGGEVEQARASLAQSQNAVTAARAAKQEFPRNYRQLVVLGKAVPASDDTASLLVEVNHIANRSSVRFESIQYGTNDGSASTEAPAAAPETQEASPESEAPEGSEESESPAVPASSPAPATEAAAAQLPIGATIGPAGLGVLPYDLTFNGSFFNVADFIQGIDSQVHTGGQEVSVDGRLVTLDGFALNGDPNTGFPKLQATFSVTTYLVPSSQGITAGATATAPASTVSSNSPSAR